jgi:TPR repeat protein
MNLTTKATLLSIIIASQALSNDNFKLQLDKFDNACKTNNVKECKKHYEFFSSLYPLNAIKNEDLFINACESNIEPMCSSGAKNLENTSPSMSLNLYKMSCKLKNKKSCTDAGLQIKAVYANEYPQEQFKYYLRGCNLGDARGCELTADLLSSELFTTNQATQSNLYSLYKKGCHYGSATSCYKAIKFSDNSFEDENLMSQACSAKDPNACYLLAYKYENQEDTLKQSISKKLYEKACSLGHHSACYKEGKIAEENGYTNSAMLKYIKACELGYKRACKKANLKY